MENYSKEKLPPEAIEYKHFILEYLIPLLGLNNVTLQRSKKALKKESIGKFIYQDGKTVYLTNGKEILFRFDADFELCKDNLKIANLIILCFTKISKYDISNGNCRMSYESDTMLRNNYKSAIQSGICEWVGGNKNEKVEKLFNILENWSVKTHEGKKVALGFIINPTLQSSFDTSFGDWCDFLNDDYSAVLTDCFNSVIELDKDCNFCRYISITESNRFKEVQLKHDIPYRYTNIINEYVKGDSVGIFLLSNGDIILSKKSRVLFVKRNLKWLNFSYEAFEKVIHNCLGNAYVGNALLKEIFASVLDVSFSHSGGIISVVDKEDRLTEREADGTSIINKSDYLLAKTTLPKLKKELTDSGLNEEEANK